MSVQDGDRRRGSFAALVLLALGIAAAAGASEEAADRAHIESQLLTGRYDEVVERLAEPERNRDLLAAALRQLGRYGEAEAALRRGAEEAGFTHWNRLGELLVLQGRSDEARPFFERALAERTPDALVARLNLALLDLDRGRLEAGRAGLYSLIDSYNRRQRLSAAELTAVGRACQGLGNDNHQLFKDALKAYDEAVEADPSALEPRVRLGELFLEKYDSTEARVSVQDVLEVNPNHPEALLAMARILHFDGAPEAMELTDRALEINPNLVPARAFRAELLLEVEDYAAAEAEAEKALEVNPESLEALGVLAAAHYLEGDEESFAAVRGRVLERNPRYAELYNQLADAAVRNRLYREAAELARRAVELDPRSWRGHGLEGLNLLRLGAIEDGREKLEMAFAGDPYDVWIKNTLDLLDTFPEYRTSRSERFELFIHDKEAALLAPYMSRLAEEAYSALAGRYRMEPPTPIRLEVFPSHADFSVRTVGLAGLGALGVCFGPVIALDSPSAREIGSFNWGSTLWHELAHTFTLTATNHRIPRWLTEGLSVLEERRGRPGWGDDVTPSFLLALKRGELLGLADINMGFIRPTHPEQIAFSYLQASLITELIEREWGFDKILAMLREYAAGAGTPEIFERVLETDLESFDRRFFADLETRFATPLAALGDPEAEDPPDSPAEIASWAEERPGDFRAQISYGAQLFSEKRYDDARPYLERARDLFPQYAGPGNPYRMLARIAVEQGDRRRAVSELEAMIAVNETDYESHLLLADLLAELGEPQREVEALERLLFIYPLEIPLHQRMAERYAELGRLQEAVRERSAVVALRPPDRAAALYRLALAYRAAGEPAGARRAVLEALEIAPSYDEAQALLLEIYRGES